MRNKFWSKKIVLNIPNWILFLAAFAIGWKFAEIF